MGGDASLESKSEVTQYSYLNVTTEEICRTHTPDPQWPLPDCTATKYNYYVREDRVFSDYDEPQICKILAEACKAGEWCQFKASDKETFDKFCTAISDENWLSGVAYRLQSFDCSVHRGSMFTDDSIYCIYIYLE